MKKSQIRYGVFCAVVVCLSAFGSAFGQEFRGTITGNINDSSGARFTFQSIIWGN